MAYLSIASYVVLNQMASLLFCFGQSPETSNMQLHNFDSFLGQRICPFILCCRVPPLLGYEMHIFGIIRVKNASF